MEKNNPRQLCFKRPSIHFLAVILVFCSLFNIQVCGAAAQKMVHDDLFSVTFPTQNEGWACGRWGTILHTADGGTSWSRQISGTSFTLVSICFSDAMNGWAVGANGTILHTPDGGKTWNAQSSPIDFLLRDVYFPSGRKGWIVTEKTHILYTENGGETWQVQFADGDFELKALHFSDDHHGWAVGEFGYIYHTADGGKNWRQQAGRYELNEDGDLVGGASLFDVVAIDEVTVWAVGMDGTVIKTTDGGLSWAKIDASMSKSSLFCILANSDGRLVIGGRGVCFYSMDRGETWKHAQFEPTIEYSWIYGMAEQGRNSRLFSVGEQGAMYVCDSPDQWLLVTYLLK